MFTVHHFFSLERLSLSYQMSYKLKQRRQGSRNYIGNMVEIESQNNLNGRSILNDDYANILTCDFSIPEPTIYVDRFRSLSSKSW